MLLSGMPRAVPGGIAGVADGTAWSALTTGAYCNYNNTTNTDTINTYGRLYNWYTLNDSRNMAPTGWHIPSDTEWTTLTTYLGGESVAGGKLKENCTTFWNSPNIGATNESGFTGLPGGYRIYYSYGSFSNLGYFGRFWSATEYFSSYAWSRYLNYNNAEVSRYGDDVKTSGFSVRCLKD